MCEDIEFLGDESQRVGLDFGNRQAHTAVTAAQESNQAAEPAGEVEHFDAFDSGRKHRVQNLARRKVLLQSDIEVLADRCVGIPMVVERVLQHLVAGMDARAQRATAGMTEEAGPMAAQQGGPAGVAAQGVGFGAQRIGRVVCRTHGG